MQLVKSNIKKYIKMKINQKRRYSYHIDVIKFENRVFQLEFWLYTLGEENPAISVEFKTNDGLKKFDLEKPFVRQDVFEENDRYQNAYRCGYKFVSFIEAAQEFTVSLQFSTDVGKQELKIGKFQPNKTSGRLEVIEHDDSINYTEIQKKKKQYLKNKEKKLQIRKKIDIIVPVFNGYKYLEKLFLSIKNTQMDYRIIAIDDASSDCRVNTFLHEVKKQFKEFVLLENEINLGFVKSVNKGFAIAENDIALVNTDVEVPELWLERLMVPIFENDNVATTTPFTNSGTICSFPEFLRDNNLFENMDVNEIDDAFKSLVPEYNAMPTGVGFCMGINYQALQKVGEFDADTFGKGYGEENDWCQRAIQKGYKNVHVENLFVYHNHGGSFLTKDKIRYLAENEKKLLKKHPKYNRDVARFVKKDPAKKHREQALLELIIKVSSPKTIVAFNHSLGGGATAYLENLEREETYKNSKIITVQYDYGAFYWIDVVYKRYKVRLKIQQLEEVFDFLQLFDTTEILINELVTYQDVEKVIDSIIHYKNNSNASLIMLLHDYYCICPSTNLLNHAEEFCQVPDLHSCKECEKYLCKTRYAQYENMNEWRRIWSKLLTKSDGIIAFSDASKILLEKAYPEISNIIVKPHQVSNLLPLNKKKKTTSSINIGLLGVMTKHKGISIVKEMLRYLKEKNINARIILIGESEEKLDSELFIETGHYTREEIPKLIYRYDIDIFMVPSIWPETFSYTTEEIMKLNMPIAVFDIGAPAERVRKYEKGIILSKMAGKESVDEIISYWKNFNIEVPKADKKKILFITEYVSFSSRYRVSHFREQLSYQYIPSDFVQSKNIKSIRLKNYNAIVLYRCGEERKLKHLIRQAKHVGIPVFYDIDDYIFEYDKIKHLQFLEQKGYKHYRDYSTSLKNCMSMCDGYITSTETLKRGIEESFPDKTVILNRNVASMQMLTLSIKAQQQIKRNEERVVLGYFSGSTTHNKDFELISNVLVRVLDKNKTVDLILVGHIASTDIFKPFENRIRQVDFMDWKECPELQAFVDIHLMPLENSFFHRCKSENKWTEASLVKRVVVASWNEELEKVMEDRKTAFLCKTEEEWENVLNELIHNPRLREEIANAAYEEVLSSHTTLNTGKTALETIKKIIRCNRGVNKCD